ncbi:MAG: DEAD/DEAH box helicase [Planctomycetes bacterium]|nr:DEAD/DEAH box helicase [Planctomycetota bacterium]MBU1517400.1 DEAD/DEAH box helicase [Planctomycetota bacterium]MBU2457760.1 DEAD/DEAH box helicase [Planctomycetota bacterium]MBU2597417.1 DEAD/DEAH box helicase [Planctomycetota bacterium]
MPFNLLGLSDPLVRGILATGYKAPTEIQLQVIPAAVEGKDIIGCAQTGTGKTAAFVLPILNRLSHEHATKSKHIKALILTPTRELALQIEQCIIGYGRFLNMRTLTVYGGVNIKGQFSALNRGVDIVVATPGRLLDHMGRRTINLRHVEVLVLDEADRMFDMGFINDVRKIIAVVPQKRQTLLFSATIPPEVKTLAAGVMNHPKIIQVGQQRNPIETITQHIYSVRREEKMEVLLHMLQKGGMYSVLVFSRTKHGADRINHRLKRGGVNSVAIHSGRTQGQRRQAMQGFKNGKFQVMVATDIAARGIDVEGISHVINFDVPVFAEDYIHRIGRTGRATATGDAITFVCRDEEKYLRQIEWFIERKFKIEKCPGFVSTMPDLPPSRPVIKPKHKFTVPGRKRRHSRRK